MVNCKVCRMTILPDFRSSVSSNSTLGTLSLLYPMLQGRGWSRCAGGWRRYNGPARPPGKSNAQESLSWIQNPTADDSVNKDKAKVEKADREQ